MAEQEGIEDTVHTLKLFSDEFTRATSRVFVASGYASRPGDAKSNLPLVEAARNLGRQVAESLLKDNSV